MHKRVSLREPKLLEKLSKDYSFTAIMSDRKIIHQISAISRYGKSIELSTANAANGEAGTQNILLL